MSLDLNFNYKKNLESTKAYSLKSQKVQQKIVVNGQSALRTITIPDLIIPALNTDIEISTLPLYSISEHPGLMAVDYTKLPENFNWRENGDSNKRNNLSKPGNQMLCGSCWAISTAGIVADNHVIAETVDWQPNLSTTWCLACYPQLKCQGGNPAKLFEDISKNGIATNNCIDYSWCSENEKCNGKATKHFEAKNFNLSTIIPDCGCYDSSDKHYLYYIEPPTSISIGRGGMTSENFFITVKKHIYKYGPVQGGYLVFKNFRSGMFTKINGGVYLETAIYDDGELHFDENQINPENYVGSHAVAVIGWGIEKNIVVDNSGTRKDVPYWYCRNSWTEKWGDNGYFKMAMYPYNKLVQFDKTINIQTPDGNHVAGSIVAIKAIKPPELKTLNQISEKFRNLKKAHEDSYYKTEIRDKAKIPSTNIVTEIKTKIYKLPDKIQNILKTHNYLNYILIFIGVLVLIFILYVIYNRISIKIYKNTNSIIKPNRKPKLIRKKSSKLSSKKQPVKYIGRSGIYS